MTGKHRKAPAKLLRKSSDPTQQLKPVKVPAKNAQQQKPRHAKD